MLLVLNCVGSLHALTCLYILVKLMLLKSAVLLLIILDFVMSASELSTYLDSDTVN
jgi:hypothetical protein